MIRFLCALALLVLAGCMKEEPPAFVASVTPPIPADCLAMCPAEPKLPDQDISDVAAVRDREKLKSVIRCNQHYRDACAAQLKVILPQSKPEGAQ
jgi:hypothetical protein